MSLSAGVLEPDALRAAEHGFELDVRLAWYRSLPLSCVTAIHVAVDGEAVAEEDVTVAVDGGAYRVAELADRVDDWWFVLDPATVRVARDTPVRAGETATVTVRLGLRIPYIEVGPDRFLEIVTDASEELTAR